MTETKTVIALIALAEEHLVFQNIFPVVGDHSTETHIILEHSAGRDGFRLISILALQMGSQSALLSANRAIELFSPDLMVVIGIAGGLDKDIMIGDVCVSNEVIDVLHNTKIQDANGKSEISFAPDFYNIDAELVSSFTFLRVHPGYQGLYKNWRTAEALPEGSTLAEVAREGGPDLHIGPIACGPVVASEQFNDKLKALHRKVTAIETESGGVFGRLAQSKIPAIAIRGISDLADGGKAEVESRTGGEGRALAMRNACRLLKQQLLNDRFTNVAVRYNEDHSEHVGELFPRERAKASIIAELDADIKAKLTERSAEFRAKPDSFYLPIPRARKISYAEDLTGRQVDSPQNLLDCLVSEGRILIRLPRSYPSQALGWSLAYSLVRQQIEGKVVLPYVISGQAVNPPTSGLVKALPSAMASTIGRSEFIHVIIIEEPLFHARNRMKFLDDELAKIDAKILIITKAEDTVAESDEFIKSNGFKEYEIAPVSFAETAFFLEKAFDMPPREAEAIAIRLDDTFRKFRLDAHPTYFASLQEETLIALINANKRAELIQLAVDALLTLMVAADKSSPPLSRTTRERFLKKLVTSMAEGEIVDDLKLLSLASLFLDEHMFSTPAPDFLAPFFEIGILYRLNGTIFISHPYVESYLLAQALREQPELAVKYLDPSRELFNYYAFDLYCELGPSCDVIRAILEFSEKVVKRATELYPGQHVYLCNEARLTTLSSSRQLISLTGGLMATAEKLEQDDPKGEVRAEKQRILDARQYVRTEIGSRNLGRTQDVPEELREEFKTLDNLARALALSSIAVGSGSESLQGDEKLNLAELVLKTGEKFSDVWTRNRLRIDFSEMRNDMLSDDNVWKIVEQFGVEDDQFEAIKRDLQIFIHGFELNTMLEPMGRVLWRVSATAGVRVLAPVLNMVRPEGDIQKILRSAWMMDINAERGRDLFKESLGEYKGAQLMRIVLATHLLWRVFWHHHKSTGSRHFVNTARRALRPLGLSPTRDHLQKVERGAA